MSHSNEPWVFDSSTNVIKSNDGWKIAYAYDHNCYQNGPRIAACVNACAGIDTEDLKRYYNTGGGINEAMEEATLRSQIEVVKQRNELLSLVEEVFASRCNHGAGWSLRASDIIDRVKGVSK